MNRDFNNFEADCNCILEDFIDSLMKDNRYTKKPVSEDDIAFVEENNAVLFNDRGMNMIERYRARLWKLAESKFPGQVIDLNPVNLIES